MIRVTDFLDDHGIPYTTSSKHSTAGWVNMPCHIHGGTSSNHLGVSLEGGNYHCWKCRAKGSFFKLIKTLLNCSSGEAKDVYNRYSDRQLEPFQDEIRKRATTVELPDAVPEGLGRSHRAYLIGRGFDPDALAATYGIYGTGPIGTYRHRIVIPCVERGRIVNFDARDISGKARDKYLRCPNEQAIYSRNECLYNIDTVRHAAIVCEGVTDVWRLGPGSVCTYGTAFSKQQVRLLVDRGVKIVGLCFDGEKVASAVADTMAAQLSPFVEEVIKIDLVGCDPAELTDAEVHEVRRGILE